MASSDPALCIQARIRWHCRSTFGILVLLLASSTANAETVVGRATVIDGDTLEIQGERIRLLDIDAPERGQLCFKKLQSIDEGAWPCGLQAALALSDWIGEQTVTCETGTQETTELSKTWLARCSVAGQDVAEWLAGSGWAVPDRKCKCDATRDAAHNARAARLAIWTSVFTMPWEWRAAH